ncbi:MAG: hypothetical protein GY926_26675 [bacterium]|nr:hypothetical protein [bacterium]
MNSGRGSTFAGYAVTSGCVEEKAGSLEGGNEDNERRDTRFDPLMAEPYRSPSVGGSDIGCQPYSARSELSHCQVDGWERADRPLRLEQPGAGEPIDSGMVGPRNPDDVDTPGDVNG